MYTIIPLNLLTPCGGSWQIIMQKKGFSFSQKFVNLCERIYSCMKYLSMVRAEYGSLYGYITLFLLMWKLSKQIIYPWMIHFVSGNSNKRCKNPGQFSQRTAIGKACWFYCCLWEEERWLCKCKYVLPVKNTKYSVSVMAQSCLIACHPLSIVGDLIICMVQCYISVGVKFSEKDDKWNVSSFHFQEKFPDLSCSLLGSKSCFLPFSALKPKEVLVAQDSSLVIDVLSLGHDVSFLPWSFYQTLTDLDFIICWPSWTSLYFMILLW